MWKVYRINLSHLAHLWFLFVTRLRLSFRLGLNYVLIRSRAKQRLTPLRFSGRAPKAVSRMPFSSSTPNTMPYALCAMPFAPCSMPHALCPKPCAESRTPPQSGMTHLS